MPTRLDNTEQSTKMIVFFLFCMLFPALITPYPTPDPTLMQLLRPFLRFGQSEQQSREVPIAVTRPRPQAPVFSPRPPIFSPQPPIFSPAPPVLPQETLRTQGVSQDINGNRVPEFQQPIASFSDQQEFPNFFSNLNDLSPVDELTEDVPIFSPAPPVLPAETLRTQGVIDSDLAVEIEENIEEYDDNDIDEPVKEAEDREEVTTVVIDGMHVDVKDVIDLNNPEDSGKEAVPMKMLVKMAKERLKELEELNEISEEELVPLVPIENGVVVEHDNKQNMDMVMVDFDSV